jgi:adenine-specific DNA methylase
MTKPKKLIEVAMPIKEVSAESKRDKSIRHGHVSTLHLWWARRPLPVCRAVVFASLVPDPLDPRCPQAFVEAVDLVVGKSAQIPGNPYKTYPDIPYTVVFDPVPDNPRNRLLAFMGKFSDKFAQNEKAGRNTDSKDLLDAHSLIK